MGTFRDTHKQQTGNKSKVLLNKGTVQAFKSQPEVEATLSYAHSVTVPMKPSLKPGNGSSVPPQCAIYLPHVLLKPRLYSGFWVPAGKVVQNLLPHPWVVVSAWVTSNTFCRVTAICKMGWGLGALGHCPASDPSLTVNGYTRLWPGTAGPTATCILASAAYPSSFLPFRFSFGEARGDALAFQSFTGSLCVDALAPNPPDVEAKLATSSSWSLWRNSRGEDITCNTGQH